MKPFVKWAGGKYNLSKTIIDASKELVDFQNFDTYIDPFVGGGGMFFSIAKKYTFNKIIISDINKELINTYIQIRDNLTELVERLSEIQNKYNSLSSLDKKSEYYYKIRKKFNNGIKQNKQDVIQASLFIALNKLDFNGLYRVNSKGLFNVPFGQKNKVTLFDLDNLKQIKQVLLRAEIYVQDYKECLEYVDSKSLVYFDSPYRPLPNTNSFTSYTKSDFNDEDQTQLAELSRKVKQKGGTFILSNSDPKQVDKNDNFFDDLYSDCIIKRIIAPRVIGSNAKSRGKVSEILVIGKGIIDERKI